MITMPVAASASLFPRLLRLATLTGAALVLAACASSPPSNISLIPATKTDEQTSKEGLFTQPLKWDRKKPGCSGECPEIKVDSLVFPGNPKLTELIDHALAVMTGVGSGGPRPYDTLAGYETYFWKVAAPRDSTVFSAKTRYRNKHLTVVQLDSWQYFTGAAHGINATQFLNWDNTAGKALGLANILQPGKEAAYVEALRQAHARWLENNDDAKRDPATYQRLWPFQPSDNFAFTDSGLVVKYDSYAIAPYSFGQPELLIPYSALQGVLRSEFMPS